MAGNVVAIRRRGEQQKILELTRLLRPADPSEFDAAFRPALALRRDVGKWRAERPVYWLILVERQKTPGDILAEAVLRCIAEVKWFPLVAEIAGAAVPLVEQRRLERRRLVEAMVPGAELDPAASFFAWSARQDRIRELVEELDNE